MLVWALGTNSIYISNFFLFLLINMYNINLFFVDIGGLYWSESNYRPNLIITHYHILPHLR